ncbi:MAG: hypothetical protein J5I92_10440 [Thiogranum sp.]|nr:hypothetical protein [Thiogranum sp.]
MTQNDRRTKNTRETLVLACLAGIVSLTLAGAGTAGDLERRQAKRIHDRLTGTPPTAAVLDRMEAELPGDPAAAAMIAIDGPNNPNSKYFYNVTLKNFATPWTNRDQSVFEPLNDYTATVIGMIRDDVPFNQLLSADILYVGAGALPGVSAYSASNNQHYADLESQGVDLSDPANLIQVTQSSRNALPSNATAGVMTTRAASEAFFIAGTNRAMFRFTMLNHLCNDMEQVKDTSRPPDRIRQDVSRSPGGDSRLFLNGCVGCHNGMDPLAQAFAYYDYDETSGRVVYTPGQVQPKYLINADNFKYGYITPDDHWDNYWRSGPNAALGWDSGLPGTGAGAKSMGQELANSDAFARCQVTKVFRNVCLGDPDQNQLDTLVASLQAGYSLKQVFAASAAQCMGN